MLKRLRISNYVLIDQAELDLSRGLTVLTGETGSGKSILLGALHLILGDRADLDVMRSPEEKCIVEAVFELQEDLKPFFESEDLDFEAETIVRREISPNGKSRAFINDTPVNLKTLKELGSRVVDIHSQMETSRLREKSFRFELLDACAKQHIEVRSYAIGYKQLLSLRAELEELKEQERRSKLDLDYFRFQFEEINAVAIDSVDAPALEEEAQTLRNADTIALHLHKVSHVLEESDEAILPPIKALIQNLDSTSEVHSSSRELRDRLNSVYIELQDIAAEAVSNAEGISHDPARLHSIEFELDQVYTLMNKHRLGSIAELIALREDLKSRIDAIDSLEEVISERSASIVQLEKDLNTTADSLHQARVTAARTLEDQLHALLVDLKMPHAKLHFALSTTNELGVHGKSDLAMLFTANKGAEPLALEKSASGGELSRLMLALKAVVSNYRSMPTLILDEIDSGVSGDIAARMAETMKHMAKGMQLIAISHLPQVAAKAVHHFKVLKETSHEATFTRINYLNASERIEELAGMLSGEVITESAREHARALLA
jgi:DNA repair protein RecN (Recombination protein N)